MTKIPLFEETVESQEIYVGKRIRCRKDLVRLSNGRLVQRDVIDHPEAVGILPLLENDCIGLVKQYRYPLEKVSIEIPAGCIEENEEPLHAARRELKEEMGYNANQWNSLTSVYLAPGFCNERMHIYLASEIQKGPQSLDDDEFVEVLELPLVTAFEWVQSGVIDDGKTVLAISMLTTQLG